VHVRRDDHIFKASKVARYRSLRVPETIQLVVRTPNTAHDTPVGKAEQSGNTAKRKEASLDVINKKIRFSPTSKRF